MGITNNPNGAPDKMNTWGWLFRKWGVKTLKELQEINTDELCNKEHAVLKVIEDYLVNNNIQALDRWMDREEGKAKSSLELSGQVNIPQAQINIDGNFISDN